MGERSMGAWSKGAGLALAVLVTLSGSTAMAVEARIVVEAVGQEDQTMAILRTNLIATGMGQTNAEQIVSGLDHYIHERVREGKKIVLFPEAMILLTRSAYRQGWPSEDVSVFLIYIQAELEDDKESASSLVQHALGAIRSNKSAQAAIARLEEGEAVRRSLD